MYTFAVAFIIIFRSYFPNIQPPRTSPHKPPRSCPPTVYVASSRSLTFVWIIHYTSIGICIRNGFLMLSLSIELSYFVLMRSFLRGRKATDEIHQSRFWRKIENPGRVNDDGWLIMVFALLIKYKVFNLIIIYFAC